MKPKSNRQGDIYKPAKYDACQTPRYALDPLMPYIEKQWVVWECASGEGLISDEFLRLGFNVIATDILCGRNFFEYEPEYWYCIITNPPYSIKYKWLERCYQLDRPFALLMPIETLGAAKAQKLFKLHGMELIVLNKRVNFKMPSKGWTGIGAQFPVGWFTWQLNIGRDITYAEIEYDITHPG
jgi:hypothetical protein